MPTTGRKRSLRSRLFSALLAVLLPAALLLVLAVEMLLVPTIKQHNRQEMSNAAGLLRDTVHATASVAIRNHLQTIAERHRQIARHHLELADHGVLEMDEAVARIRRIMLAQRIGSSGYVYCIDSQGNVPVHPNAEVEGTNQASFEFVREQMHRKDGYLEYDWRNPGTPRARAKALYMVHLEPLDWIISASSYREEFEELLRPADFRDAVLSLRFGRSGYAYLFSPDGQMLIHPSIQGMNVLEEMGAYRAFAEQMVQDGSGIIDYVWREPDTGRPREKTAVFTTVPDFGWVIAASAYKSEMRRPVQLARATAYGGLLLLLLGGAATAYFLSTRLTRPVQAMVTQLDHNARSGEHAALPVPPDRELGHLAEEFNRFLNLVDERNRSLARERSRYQALVAASPAYIVTLDLHGRVLQMNDVFCKVLGKSPGEVAGVDYFALAIPEAERERIRATLEMVGERARDEGSATVAGTNAILAAQGDERMVEWRVATLDGEDNGDPIILAVGIDITEERELQAQLHHAQKLDALGCLAGGVAHDFNNMVGGIMAATELLGMKLAADDPNQRYVGMILDTAERAAELAKRLLSFSRKHKKISTPMDVHAALEDALRIARSGMDPRIETDLQLAAERSILVGDPSELQNAFLNLFINARDAMPDGGRLIITTRNITLGADACVASAFDLDPGDFIAITVADTGTGIDPQIQERVFEPFFTTKPEGRGTGLGLAAAYGAIQAHAGEIRVSSTVGAGTTFIINLPIRDVPHAHREAENALTAGSGTILLVDDDEVLRATGQIMLEELGYRVLTARDGNEGVKVFEQHRTRIDLVILDMVMPGRNGRDVFELIRALEPEARVLLCSGFVETQAVADLRQRGLAGLLRKPYTGVQLSRAVAGALAAPR